MILETDRLILRKPIPADFDRFWEMINDPVAKQYTGGITQLTYVQRFARFEEECACELSSRNAEFAVIEKESGHYLGYCGFRYSQSLRANEFLYGYCRDAWGKGYATEAAVSVLEYLFHAFPHTLYVATVHPENSTSISVLRKAGFTETGRIQLDCNETALLYQRHLHPAE